MHVFEIVIALLLAGAGLAALARRIGTPYPALVALAGAVLALLPGMPAVVLDPELALTLFVAPVLLDAAFDASPRDLRTNWRPVASLALGAVILTVAGVAVVARALVPGMPWAAAIALGAIVAPPDAAAATAVLRQLKPPHQLLVILEGESLFNDASALLIYRLAVASAATGAVLGWEVVPVLLLTTAGSVVLALVLARLTMFVNKGIEDVPTAVIVQFCSTFAVWILAERLHLSAILTMVVYAMAVARVASELVPARIRIPSYAVWEVVVFVLNVLAFIIVGLQLKPIIWGFDRPTLIEYGMVAAAVCGVAILARILWVTGAVGFSRWWWRRHRGSAIFGGLSAIALSPKAGVVMAWCGMRGTVTLAAALALPAGGEGAFPFRDLILFTAFAVVLGTLVLQGLTLRPIMERLNLEDDGEVEREVRHARAEVLRAGLDVTSTVRRSEAIDVLHRRYQLRLRQAESQIFSRLSDPRPTNTGVAPVTSATDLEAFRSATEAVRRRLSALRADGTIGDDAFHRVELELDMFELDLEQFVQAELEEGR